MLDKIFVFVLIISFVSAVDIDLDCPDEIYVGEEFECSVEVSDGDGVYDLKVDLDGERDSVLRIWDGETWKSGYYYLIDFIEDVDEDIVRLKVLEERKYDGVLKLRQGDVREEFDIEMRVKESRDIEKENENGVGNLDTSHTDFMNAEKENVEIVSLNKNEAISLNGNVDSSEEEWDYVSKDGKIIEWLPYGFCLFLILVIGILVWDKF